MSWAGEKNYLDAVLCSMQQPSVTRLTPFLGPRTLFDDFQALHEANTYVIC
jgi:hypothetical protein